ncbi:hypothetical protein Tsubulata_021221, partial [Turnera subulata]
LYFLFLPTRFHILSCLFPLAFLFLSALAFSAITHLLFLSPLLFATSPPCRAVASPSTHHRHLKPLDHLPPPLLSFFLPLPRPPTRPGKRRRLPPLLLQQPEDAPTRGLSWSHHRSQVRSLLPLCSRCRRHDQRSLSTSWQHDPPPLPFSSPLCFCLRR